MSGRTEIPAGAPWSVRRERLRRGLLALFLAVEAAAVLALAVAGALPAPSSADDHRAYEALVQELRLTGITLWSEASYCRQPALSELFTPHSFHPTSPDPLPAGSVVPPHPWIDVSKPAEGATGGGGS